MVVGIEEEIRPPLLSGHCGHPATNGDSHARCDRMGAGNRANPGKVFQPCPCPHHLKKKRFECECGGTLAKAKGALREALIEVLGEEPDEDVYVHVDKRTNRMVGVYCDG